MTECKHRYWIWSEYAFYNVIKCQYCGFETKSPIEEADECWRNECWDKGQEILMLKNQLERAAKHENP